MSANSHLANDLELFISAQLAKHRLSDKPLLFVASENHASLQNKLLEALVLQHFLNKGLQPSQIKLFIEDDSLMGLDMLLTNYKDESDSWVMINKLAKNLGVSSYGVDTAYDRGSYLIKFLLFFSVLAVFLKQLSKLVLDDVAASILVLSITIPLLVACLYLGDKYLSELKVSPEGMDRRDKTMIENILQKGTSYRAGLVVVGSAHASKIIEELDNTGKFTVISLPFEPKYRCSITDLATLRRLSFFFPAEYVTAPLNELDPTYSHIDSLQFYA